jgi:hypothetical protein
MLPQKLVRVPQAQVGLITQKKLDYNQKQRSAQTILIDFNVRSSFLVYLLLHHKKLRVFQ